MKNRIIRAILLALCITMLTGCSLSASDSQDTKPIVPITGDSPEEPPVSADETTKKPEDKWPTIEEQLCFTYEGLTVTAKSFTHDTLWGSGIKLLVENNSDKDLSVGCEAVIVNDYMLADLFSCQVAAGKKANDTLYLSSDSLNAASIDRIGKIEIYFYVYDSVSYDTLFTSNCVTLKTSFYDDMDCEPNDTGVELYHADGIRIVGKYVDENSFWGKSVLLYVENKSNQNITVSCDDLSVNGYMINSFMSTTVYQGKMAIDTITLLSSDLEENDIQTVDSIELKFRIYDPDTYDTIVETDPITFGTK